MTRTNAGPIPRQKAPTPSFARDYSGSFQRIQVSSGLPQAGPEKNGLMTRLMCGLPEMFE